MNRLLACCLLVLFAPQSARGQQRRALHDGWLLQSSAKAGADGATISSPSYEPRDWYRATVPSTVVGALVEDSVYRDPFFGMNLRSLPGMTYPIGATSHANGRAK